MRADSFETQNQITELEANIEHANQEIDDLRSEVIQQNQSIATLKDRKGVLNRQVEYLTTSNNSLGTQYGRLLQENVALETEVSELNQRTSAKVLEKYVKLKAENERLREDQTSLTARFARALLEHTKNDLKNDGLNFTEVLTKHGIAARVNNLLRQHGLDPGKHPDLVGADDVLELSEVLEEQKKLLVSLHSRRVDIAVEKEIAGMLGAGEDGKVVRLACEDKVKSYWGARVQYDTQSRICDTLTELAKTASQHYCTVEGISENGILSMLNC